MHFHLEFLILVLLHEAIKPFFLGVKNIGYYPDLIVLNVPASIQKST